MGHAEDLALRDIEADERGLPYDQAESVTEDLQLQEAGTGLKNIQGDTQPQQVNPREYAALFPGDTTGQAIAERGSRRA